jgi:hypothetical protein
MPTPCFEDCYIKILKLTININIQHRIFMFTKPLVYINFQCCSVLYVVRFSLTNHCVSFFAILCKLNINVANFEIVLEDKHTNNFENITVPDSAYL